MSRHPTTILELTSGRGGDEETEAGAGCYAHQVDAAAPGEEDRRASYGTWHQRQRTAADDQARPSCFGHGRGLETWSDELQDGGHGRSQQEQLDHDLHIDHVARSAQARYRSAFQTFFTAPIPASRAYGASTAAQTRCCTAATTGTSPITFGREGRRDCQRGHRPARHRVRVSPIPLIF